MCNLPIKRDTETAAQAWASTALLAERHRLRLYDACYLELAHRLKLPVATLDLALRVAAQAAEVALLGAECDGCRTSTQALKPTLKPCPHPPACAASAPIAAAH